jgi:hydroxypyruvate isomerase
MDRRSFIATGAAVATGALIGAKSASAAESKVKNPFKLKYAPHFGMFQNSAGKDLVDQLKFMADNGFRAMEDNGMKGRPVAVQERVAQEMGRLGIEMGVFVAHGDFGSTAFVSGKKEDTERILGDMRKAVEVAKRVNAKWCTVVPDAFVDNMEWDYQTANVIDNLKRAAEICEPAGLTMVLEPLNAWTDHPGLFLTKVPQAFMICRAVDSPSCKILNDLYHQQITEGNLIPNLDMAWDEIGYFQVGDNPGRKEPTTGEINYRNIFKHLHKKGCDMIIGMEHGNSQNGKAGEQAVIDAYRQCDDF